MRVAHSGKWVAGFDALVTTRNVTHLHVWLVTEIARNGLIGGDIESYEHSFLNSYK